MAAKKETINLISEYKSAKINSYLYNNAFNLKLTTGRGFWGGSPHNSPSSSPVGSPEIHERSGSFSRFFKEMKSIKDRGDKDKGMASCCANL